MIRNKQDDTRLIGVIFNEKYADIISEKCVKTEAWENLLNKCIHVKDDEIVHELCNIYVDKFCSNEGLDDAASVGVVGCCMYRE